MAWLNGESVYGSPIFRGNGNCIHLLTMQRDLAINWLIANYASFEVGKALRNRKDTLRKISRKGRVAKRTSRGKNNNPVRAECNPFRKVFNRLEADLKSFKKEKTFRTLSLTP